MLKPFICVIRRKAFIILFLLLANCLFATDSTETWQKLLKDFKIREIETDWLTPSTDKNLIREMEVIDIRPDTAHIGMFANNYFKPTILIFRNDQLLSNVIELKLSNKNTPGCSVLMIVRDFWMNDIKPRLTTNDGVNKSEFQTSKVVFNVDIFLKTDNNYVPLTRIDSIIWNKKAIANSADFLFEKALSTIHFKIQNALDQGIHLKRKKEIKQTIIDYYKSKMSTYFIKDIMPRKGLYSSFDQFKANQPLTENFLINRKTTEPATLFRVDDQGGEALTRNVWGVCDGVDFYIMQNSMLFKLYKDGNAYYWMGLKKYDSKTYGAPAVVPLGGGAAVGLTAVATEMRIRLTPNLLNMTTGKEY